MKCPHCFAAVPPGQAVCPHCGFSAAAVRNYLGCEWVRLERISDQALRLSLKDSRRLEASLDEFERAFPQCFLAVYLGPLPAELTVGDLGFWLINHGAFVTHLAAKRNDFGILLVIDPARQSAGFTVGYALEPILSESVLADILFRLGGTLRKLDFAKAIHLAIKHLGKALRARAKPEAAERHQPPAPTGTEPADLGLQTLRRNHQPPARSGPLRPQAPHARPRSHL